ncbi:proton-conducting transporter membrane subunit [Salinibaculum rarum]|uniref:proton-conducting transporter transmembrane domain-containing protein n=1 Tax=Salinibaculum rarum TaxID=3058903 RepID=UPI00265DB133|nr:proton-conducting transporter membrane subunit [Salinibaculum sp. KK48]
MTEILSLRPIAAVLVSVIAIPLIIAARQRPDVREAVTMITALTKVGLVASMLPGVLAGDVYVTEIVTFVSDIAFVLRVDALGMVFGLLASSLWVITSLYSIGYMRGLAEHSQTRYFAAFAASLSTAIGVAFAGNLVTLFIFYELLTIATYPLVAHNEDSEARAAGRKYLTYTFLGGVAVLAGVVLVFSMTGTTTFTAGGIAGLAEADPAIARLAFALLAGGFGVKAALMPTHSWLPDAMVAPTPVSGLLHAVAVVKSGVFGIARVVLDIFGPETMADLGVGVVLAAVAAFTLLTASVIALRKDHLKRRLAYSTISQLSYIVLGLGVLSGEAIVGGLLHIPAHAFMKLTLFFCAGAIHVETHTDYISEMAGIGKRMPLTMTAFAVAAAGMAGIPLIAGFVSKWYILIGSVNSGQGIFAIVLLVSGMLNIAYFWPIVYQAFFETPDDHDGKPVVEAPLGGRLTDESTTEGAVAADGGDPAEGHDTTDEHGDHDDGHHHGGPGPDGWDERDWRGGESTWFMLGPIMTAAGGAIALGLAPATFVFLELIQLVAENVGVVG